MLNNYFVCGAKVLKRDLQVVEINYSEIAKKVNSCISWYLGSLSEIRIVKGYKPAFYFKDLWDCYNKCSNDKERIYYRCVECAKKIENALKVSCACGVSSYNVNMFTYGICFTINNVTYYLYITPTKNALYIYQQD